MLQTNLLNHLWQSTLFAAIAGLLTLALKNNRAPIRYWLWFAASIKFLIPFSLLVMVGSQLEWRPASPSAPLPVATLPLASAIDDISQPFTGPAPVLLANVPSSGPTVLLCLWLCGVAVVAFGWLRQWLRVRAALQTASPLPMNLPIKAMSSPARLEPGVFGVFRPTLLVPEGIRDRLNPEQWNAIIAHELCHVRRRDNLTAAIHMAVEVIFWFHPLIWWIGKRLVDERERACDEEVVLTSTGVQGCDPEVYAESILNVCKFYLESPLRCVSGVTGSSLKQRVREIMTHRNYQALNWTRKALLAVAASVTIVGPIAYGLLNPPVSHAQAPNSFSGLQTSATKVFDVATVKVSAPESQGWQLGPPGHGAVTIRNLQLHRIIASSFRVQDSMVFGPGWLDDMRYDIVGKGPDPNASNPEVWEMMRSLLAERFKLKYHIETREVPIYALTIAKGGPKLIDGDKGRCAEDIKAGKNCGDIIFPPFGSGIYNMPVAAFIGGLARVLQDRPIVDKTGLTGKYDVTVRWMPDGTKPEDLESIPKENRPEDISLFQAVEKQAGLKLEATKGPVQVVVVDSIEKPSGN